MSAMWNEILAALIVVTIIEVAKNVFPSVPTLLEAVADRIRYGRQNRVFIDDEVHEYETEADGSAEDEQSERGGRQVAAVAATRRTPVVA